MLSLIVRTMMRLNEFAFCPELGNVVNSKLTLY